MSDEQDVTPRKKPRQRRAQETVEALLTATAQLLDEEGYEQLSTNQIARRAGVSIGSLYQYYPNKEALVFALVERLAEQQYAVVKETFAEMSELPIEEVAREVVIAILETRQLEPELNRILSEQLPRSPQSGKLRGWLERLHSLVSNELRKREHELRSSSPELAAYVLVYGMHGIIEQMGMDREGEVDHGQLVREVSEMMTRYLSKEPIP
ncbi:MAG: TetR/AcrR family transcriptional regulator [Myxococcales bacterium]|nr:TetR/AcrR family transcriptional regulator [Myxococcales bacterium]MCB9642310.1 TetR/AcrR family transcriptional regulator [Myxococcales bacterium]